MEVFSLEKTARKRCSRPLLAVISWNGYSSSDKKFTTDFPILYRPNFLFGKESGPVFQQKNNTVLADIECASEITNFAGHFPTGFIRIFLRRKADSSLAFLNSPIPKRTVCNHSDLPCFDRYQTVYKVFAV
jgi:hypothetical protein